VKHNKVKLVTRSICAISVVGGLIALSGCAAIQTEVQHHKLDVNSKMSSSVFLPPSSKKDKTVYVSVKNTSSEQNISLKKDLSIALQNNGWKVTNNYSTAHDILQINILQAGKVKSTNDLLSSLENGFGGAMVGGLAGNMATGTLEGGAVGGALGSAASWLGGLLVKDVTYAITTDVQIEAKAPKGVVVHNNSHAAIRQGSSTINEQSYNSNSDMMTYRTRIVSYANQANLKFAEAKPVLAGQMAKEIANIF
jgi:hypothetical protein